MREGGRQTIRGTHQSSQLFPKIVCSLSSCLDQHMSIHVHVFVLRFMAMFEPLLNTPERPLQFELPFKVKSNERGLHREGEREDGNLFLFWVV